MTRNRSRGGDRVDPAEGRIGPEGLAFSAFLRTLGKRHIRIVDYEGLVAVARGRKVVVLGGYSALGYKDPEALRALIRKLVEAKGDGALYIIGATGEGIGAAYTWIPELGAELRLKNIGTAGIVSVQAWVNGIADQDFVLFVDTPPGEWSVVVDGKSLMVDIAADTGGEMVYFRGGAIAGAEIREALARNVRASIVNCCGTEPDPDKVAARLAADPDYIVDGTSGLVEACAGRLGGMDLDPRLG